jgi:hypothetical protein
MCMSMVNIHHMSMSMVNIHHMSMKTNEGASLATLKSPAKPITRFLCDACMHSGTPTSCLLAFQCLLPCGVSGV